MNSARSVPEAFRIALCLADHILAAQLIPIVEVRQEHVQQEDEGISCRRPNPDCHGVGIHSTSVTRQGLNEIRDDFILTVKDFK